MKDPYEKYYNTPEFIEDLQKCEFHTDCCSSGILKIIARFFTRRVYSLCCYDHDFDCRYGWKYGMTLKRANEDLGDCAIAPGRYIIGWLLHIGTDIFSRSNFRGNWKVKRLLKKEAEEFVERVNGNFYD